MEGRAEEVQRFDRPGHLNGAHAARLLALGRSGRREPDDSEFLRAGARADELASQLGEAAVGSMTSGDGALDDELGAYVSEEVGGPFVVTSVSEELDYPVVPPPAALDEDDESPVAEREERRRGPVARLLLRVRGLGGRLRRLFGLALLAGGVFSVGGCTGAPLEREEFCERWGRAACTPEVVSVCQSSVSACQTAQAGSCREWLPDDFRDVGVDDCLDAVREAYEDADLDARELDVVWRLGPPCAGIVVAGESGDACQRDEDCSRSAGLTCVFKDEAMGTCQRAELVKAGFSCRDADQACEPGFYCNGTHCVVAAEADETCQNDSQCGEGLFCSDELCAEQLPVGADCRGDFECASRICYAVDDGERVCVNRIRLSPAEPACDTLK